MRAVLPEPDFPACSDGLDNDGDGRVDLDDPGCPFSYATIENPQCDDGVDNDGNNFTDFADSKCQASWPYWETLPACGLGAELTPVLFALAAGRRRRATRRRLMIGHRSFRLHFSAV